MPFGGSGTVTLKWSAPGAAKHSGTSWQYAYLMQRQAGVAWQMNMQVTLPTCAQVTGKPQGLTLSGAQAASANDAITPDTTFALNYSCASSTKP